MVTKKKDAKETLPILGVGVHTYFYTADGVVKAVDGVNLDVFPSKRDSRNCRRKWLEKV